MGAETGLALAFLNIWGREKHSWGFWRTPVSDMDGVEGEVWRHKTAGGVLPQSLFLLISPFLGTCWHLNPHA